MLLIAYRQCVRFFYPSPSKFVHFGLLPTSTEPFLCVFSLQQQIEPRKRAGTACPAAPHPTRRGSAPSRSRRPSPAGDSQKGFRNDYPFDLSPLSHQFWLFRRPHLRVPQESLQRLPKLPIQPLPRQTRIFTSTLTRPQQRNQRFLQSVKDGFGDVNND